MLPVCVPRPEAVSSEEDCPFTSMTKIATWVYTIQMTQSQDTWEFLYIGMTTLGTKMKEGGYATYVVGKWNVGTATYEHTPEIM